MWVLTVRSPVGEPREYILKAGRTTIGRKSGNDIVIVDDSASRQHAELFLDNSANMISLRDLGSTNGTFVNRERLTQPHILRLGDKVRIGEHQLSLTLRSNTGRLGTDQLPSTQPLTRDLLLESLDQHAILLYEAATRLNTIVDLEVALSEVSQLMRMSMGADKCEVILAENFGRLTELGFPTTFARQAIDQRSAVFVPNLGEQTAKQGGQSAMLLRVRSALVVPALIGEEVAAIIYVYKTDPASRPFTQTDMQLAIAISHQAAMTIQRTRLMNQVRQSDRISHLFQRFFSPREADLVLRSYIKSGELPGLSEQNLTALFVDIRDSTNMSERLGAQRFGNLLTAYYVEMTQAVFENDGLINTYLGDGVMAIFGALGRPEPEASAVRAALAMLERHDKIVPLAQGLEFSLAIGINTGPMMAGYVGTSERVEYTTVGETVNVAQRLERHARANRIFIGPSTFLAVNGKFKSRSIGPVEFRGITRPIEVFEILRG